MANIKIIDTHCHLYSGKLLDNIAQVVQRAMEHGVSQMYMPNVDSVSIDAMLSIESAFSNCHAMMGLHPCSVNAQYKEELRIVESWFEKRNFCGVGECGIDLYWDKTFIEEQRAAFDAQISISRTMQLPIIIHSRDAQEVTIDMIAKRQDGNLTGIFHCFGGTLDEAKKIIDLGFYMGIGGVATYKNCDVAKVVNEVGLANVVLETDSPYLAPVPKRGKENEPSYLNFVCKKLSETMQIAEEEIAEQTTANALCVFKVQ
jgi:TatD DNase family protein